jgi:hypothetical protein
MVMKSGQEPVKRCGGSNRPRNGGAADDVLSLGLPPEIGNPGLLDAHYGNVQDVFHTGTFCFIEEQACSVHVHVRRTLHEIHRLEIASPGSW